jgi:hypothetical protein
MPLQIRRTSYRNKPSLLIAGTDSRGRSIKVFAETRDAAEHIKAKLLRGENITTMDFHHVNPENR